MSANDPRRPADPTRKEPKVESPASLPVIDVGSEGMVEIGDLPISEEASAVALAQLPEPPSGQSLTSWTEVIRRQRATGFAATPSGQHVQVDAPSDRDLLAHFQRPDGSGSISDNLPRASDTSEIPQGEIPVYVPHASPISESDIDLGKALPRSAAASSSSVAFDILEQPSDAGGAIPLAALPLSHADFGIGSSAEIGIGSASAAGISGIDLGAEDVSAEGPGRSSILDVLLRESGGTPAEAEPASDLLDFGDAPPTPVRTARPTMPTISPPARSPGQPTQAGIDLADGAPPDSDLDLSGPASAHGSDEEVDLRAEVAQPASLTDSGTLEISPEALEESQRRADQMDSSSVDLNSRPSLLGSEFDVGPASGVSSAPGSDAEIDLALPPIQDEGNSSLVHGRNRLAANQEAIAAEFSARRQRRDEETRTRETRNELAPARENRRGSGSTANLVRGSVLGLILGAGGVLAAYFGGALPNRGANPAPASTDDSAALAQLRRDADSAKKEAAAAQATADASRDTLTKAGIDPAKAGEGIKALANARDASEAKAKEQADLAKQAQAMLSAAKKGEKEAKLAEATAKKNLGDAEKAAAEAKVQVADAAKAVETARAETVATKKAADASMAAITKSLEAAGIDPAKADAGLKKLVDARADAEAKEKELATKLVDAGKKEADLAKLADAAKKSAEDATRARQASEATFATIVERLAKAKFVGAKPDAAAVMKGLDDALKAATTDATGTLRDELAKARSQETKMKTDLTAAREKEAQATKLASSAQAEAKRLSDEAANFKGSSEKLATAAKEAITKAGEAEKRAAREQSAANALAAESTRLKAENERLARDLEAVRELAELIKTPAGSNPPAAKPDPVKLANRFFADGLRAFYAGERKEAETAFRKAIQFRGDDARYHYLLGLTLWMNKDEKGAELAFEKGRDLEAEARPSSRVVSASLERIQGPARQAIDLYRP